MKFGILLMATAFAMLVTAACSTTPNSVAAASQAPIPTTVGPVPGGVSEVKPRMNPYTDNAVALQKGLRLFNWYNCSGCHGGHAGGGMGPSLRDIGETQLAGDRRDQRPVRGGVAGGVDGGLKQRQIALGVDENPVGLASTCAAGQHDVGVGVGLGLGEDVLGDDELGRPPGPRSPWLRLATDATGLVQMIQQALISPSAICSNISTVPRPTSSARSVPGASPHTLLDERAVLRDQHRTLAGQPRAHVAHLPAAHRVRLAGQRERAAARAADRAGGQVQVDRSRWCSRCRGCSGSGPSSSRSSSSPASPIHSRGRAGCPASGRPVISATAAGG